MNPATTIRIRELGGAQGQEQGEQLETVCQTALKDSRSSPLTDNYVRRISVLVLGNFASRPRFNIYLTLLKKRSYLN